jgi:hypothetical protein
MVLMKRYGTARRARNRKHSLITCSFAFLLRYGAFGSCLFGLLLQLLVLLAISKALLPFTHELIQELIIPNGVHVISSYQILRGCYFVFYGI